MWTGSWDWVKGGLMGHILESDFILVLEWETMVLKSSGTQSLWLQGGRWQEGVVRGHACS